MGFWANVWNRSSTGVIPNDNGPADYNPGDPDGLEIDILPATEMRSLQFPAPSQWNGWPASWDTPDWQMGSSANIAHNKLVDIAWGCLDLNSNIVSAMPVYRMRDRRIIPPSAWMRNPDPDVYSSWQEFMKQLFWDFQMGEAFVLDMAPGISQKPFRFRVVPPWLISVDWVNGLRNYKLGSLDVTDRILHLRYQGNTADARGHGPLEVAGAKILQIKLLQRYANNMAETGGVPLYWMEVAKRLTLGEAKDLLQQWIETRSENAGHPAIVGNGAQLKQARTMDAKEMGLLEISQFSESRIAMLLGVPPFLVGLAGASGSLTYSNITDLFDFHDRSSLRPKSKMIMEALSDWALVRGQTAELNRDDYTRLPLGERMAAYKIAIELGILTPAEVRIMERYYGEPAVEALTGGEL